MTERGKNGLVLLFWLAVWSVAALVVANPLFLPAPWTVLEAMMATVQEPSFLLRLFFFTSTCVRRPVGWCVSRQSARLAECDAPSALSLLPHTCFIDACGAGGILYFICSFSDAFRASGIFYRIFARAATRL